MPVKRNGLLSIAGIVTVLLTGVFVSPALAQGKVIMVLDHRFAGKSILLRDTPFYTETGDSLFIDVVRYYISGVELIKDGRTVFQEPNSYHLVDLEAPGSTQIILKQVPFGHYDALRFRIGTDSLCNVSGANSGDLDPSLGMYWAWNSGYINVKIEGRSNASATRRHAFEFHIGGYMPPFQTIRPVILPLNHFQVVDNNAVYIPVVVDLALFFRNVHLSETNQVMIPSKTANSLADYFSRIFSVE